MNKESITLILGPGNHQQKLVEALEKAGKSFEVFYNYPIFIIKRYNENGVLINESKNLFFTKVVQLVWAICTRIRVLKNTNYHIYLSNLIFDFWVSRNYSKSSTLLWAWSQVSLKTILKFKNNKLPVILENPMIHVNEWKSILEEEYKKFAPNKYRYYEIHPKLVKQMYKEYELADRIVLLSNFAASTFIKNHINEGKLAKVNLYAYKEGVGFIQKWETDKKIRFLFVGRVDILKGIPRLLEVLKKLHNTNKNFKLTIVGDLKEELSDLFDSKIEFVEFLGTLSAESLKNVYKEHDVLILPSVQESFGLVILEALSNGLFVIASENTGALDIALKCKRVQTFNPFILTEMEKVISAALNPNYYQQNTECNLDDFSMKQYQKQIVVLLNEVLKNNNSFINDK